MRLFCMFLDISNDLRWIVDAKAKKDVDAQAGNSSWSYFKCIFSAATADSSSFIIFYRKLVAIYISSNSV